jgi:hypothetical protein
MPSQVCLCENRIDLSPVPPPRGLAIFSRPALSRIIAELAEVLGIVSDLNESVASGVLWDKLGTRHHTFAVQCDRCGRVLVLDDDWDIVASFAPDTANWGLRGVFPVCDLTGGEATS